jgi:hypothetical protein
MRIKSQKRQTRRKKSENGNFSACMNPVVVNCREEEGLECSSRGTGIEIGHWESGFLTTKFEVLR